VLFVHTGTARFAPQRRYRELGDVTLEVQPRSSLCPLHLHNCSAPSAGSGIFSATGDAGSVEYAGGVAAGGHEAIREWAERSFSGDEIHG
jgi:hypothetical protein